MSKNKKIAMIVIVIAIILIAGSTYTFIWNWKRGITKYGYKVPCEISPTYIAVAAAGSNTFLYYYANK